MNINVEQIRTYQYVFLNLPSLYIIYYKIVRMNVFFLQSIENKEIATFTT